MKRRLYAITDRIAMRTFLLVLGYWRWRTGRPAIVAVHAPALAMAQYRGETMH